ncbi:hypothetical protein PSHT_06371 [Puccinia striiformis]|uniref:Integrase catalytic domain-containing protein n=1 Tax=Puccinia striiformis TaxID=27350 RepID=A0A2S4W6W1_9BASI|nr:hypothetical protein PSHT_06371 [Puccinia striiformis]
MANNNRNKSKSRADNPDPVDSPLTSLASTSLNPPPEDDTIVQINRHFTDYNLRLRSLLRSNTDNTQQITDLSNRFTGFEVKMDNFFSRLDSALPDPTRDPPPHTAKREDNESDGDGPRPSFNQKHFMKDPMALHRSIHTSVELLKFNGENFIAWQQQLDTTLDFVFLTDRFSEKAHWSKLSAEHEPWRSDRQRKITIVNKLKDFYASEQQDSNAELIAQFQDFFLEVSQQNLSLDELLGLVLQSVVKPPIGVDENSFRNNLNHRLNTSTPAPLLDTVCQEIAQVEGELHTGTSSNPILINRLQPSGRPHQKTKSSNPGGINTSFGHKALSNALAFQGQKPSTALMAAKGDTCKYCEIKGHWASTCRRFARDLRDGKIDLAKLAEYAKDPQFNLNPSFVKVRAVDLNATPDDTVLVDSGASACVSGNSSFFVFEKRLMTPIPVLMASRKSNMLLTGVGSLKIPTPSGTIRIKNVYHNPSIPYVILSLGMLATYGLQPVFDKDCTMSLVHQHRVFRTTFSNFCWTLVTSPASSTPPSSSTPLSSPSVPPPPCNDIVVSTMTNQPSMEAIRWHERLGHANDKLVRKFLERFVGVDVAKNWKPFFCEKCVMGKITGRRFLPPSTIPKKEILDLVVSDVMGPFDKDIHGFQFAVTLRDHASMYTFISPIKTKAEVTGKLITWFDMIKNRLGRYPRFLRCDNGGEFISKKLQSLLDTRGITLAHSSPYHPEENGEAERVNRTINDMSRVMMQNCPLPQLFWSYAQQVAAYIHNRIPHSRISPQTPIELLFNQVPVPEYIYPFGARALVFRPADKRTGKFDDRADECFLVGYPPSEKGWVFYNEHLKTFIHSANAVFPDFQTLPVSGIKTSKNDISFLLNNLVLGEEPTDTEAQIQQQAVDSLLTRPDIAVPDNIHQAFSSPESSEWRKARSWNWGNWRSLKFGRSLNLEKELRLSRPGTDCGDTYAPTASLNTLRLLFSIAAQMGMKMHSFDVSSAYLYSPIEEEVYVKPPTELRPELRGKVLRLKKALYGTKQAGRCWWLHFKTILNGLNFTTSEVESSLYVYKRDDVSIFIWMHVDDGLVVSNSEAAMEELREALQKQLEVKWKTHVDQIVGINVHEKLNGIFLEQNLLATQVVTNYCRRTIHQNTTLPDISLVTSANDPVNVTDFRSVLGSLMYLACGTRPDIAYAVNMLARYSSRPSEEHWTALDHLVGYVKKNPRRAINFSQGEDAVKLYVDAGWGGEHERSTTGFILQHCGNPITWGSKRQDVVAMSTCAAEYVALSIATQTLANIKVILDDICPSQRFEILCDNQAAVLVATDNASKKKTKYLQRAFYFVNDFVKSRPLPMANNNRNKSKSRADNPDPVDSPLTSLASTSLNPPPEDDTIVQINRHFTDYNLRLRSLLRSNTDNTQQITDLSNRFTGFEREDNESDGDGPRPSFNQKHFMKDPMALHRSIHTSVELLKFNGENFIAWQQQLDTTLDFVFLTDRFSEKAHWSKLSAEHEPWRSDRQRKITIVNKLKDFYASEQQDSNAELIAQFQDFFLEVSQQNLSLDELLGLVLQSVVKPPIGVDENSFRNNLNHRLNTSTPAPLLDTVCQEIAQVEGELHTGTSSNPILINRLQPSGRPHQKTKSSNPGGINTSFGHKALSNALAFQGQKPSTALMAAKGDTCKYCEIKGHWASTCRRFARDLRDGKIDLAKLAEYAKDPQFNLNPSFVKVRAVDLNATPDDTVLVDSGASACVSGNSSFFVFEKRLMTPIPVLMASRKSNMLLTGVGSLKIPTPSGTIRIKNVYQPQHSLRNSLPWDVGDVWSTTGFRQGLIQCLGYPPSEKGWVFYNDTPETFIHSANAVSPIFRHSQFRVIKTSKNDISFLLNNLVLGEEPTDTEAQIQQQAVDSLLTRPYIAVPDNIHQAFSSPESSEWRKAVELELGQLEKLEVWEVVESRKGIKVIGARWVLALKRDTEGKITRFKARYVARGFNQRPGTDCGDTYATNGITQHSTPSILYCGHRMGMKSILLKLRPELREKSPPKKALYGTKQAGRCWWLHFKTILNGLNFTTSEVESSLYVYKRDDVSIFIWMHVDDGLVCCDKLLPTYHSPNTTLPDISLVTSANDPVNVTDFRSVLGSLMYLACGTQPDIAYAVNMLARYSSRPSEEHWTTLDHLVGYVKKNPRRAINFSQGEDAVKLYVDAGWGGEHERSTTGFILQHCGNPITWGSKRQDVVAMSTCAAEYVALSIATQTLANIKVILDDICPSQRFEILSLTLPPRTILSSKSTDTLRTIISASEAYSVATPNTQQITDLSNRFTSFEVKMDNFFSRLDSALPDPTRDPPPHTAKREDNESDGDGPRPSFNQKHFMKDPMALHRSIHTSVELLKFNGENFIAWQQQLDTTLDFVFLTDRFSEKAHWSKLSAEHEPLVTLLLRGSVEPLLFKSVRNSRKPAEIYRNLKTRCRRSDRQRKITIVNKLKDFYASEQQDSNAELIAQFQDFFLEVSQQNLSLDELLGLVLQSVVKPPIGVDENSFRNNLNHRLNTSTPAPLLDTRAAGLIKRQNLQTLGNQHLVWTQGTIQRSRFPGAEAVNRLNGCQRRHLQVLRDQRPLGVNLSSFARDLRDGKIDLAKLAEYAKDPQFNLNPSFVKVRAVDLNATPMTPSSLILELPHALKIPTPSGTIRIKNVYHNPSIPYVILSLGMLATYGLQPVFDKDCTMSLVHQHRVFRTTFSNFCWTLVTSPASSTPPSSSTPLSSPSVPPPPCNDIVVSTMTNQPSMEAIRWHERLGHANDKLVRKFLERFVGVDVAKNWKPFFCEKCVMGKITGRRFLPPSTIPKKEILDLVVSDVMGPFDKDIHGFQFAVTLRDHASMYTFISPIKTKAEVTGKLITWFDMIKNRLGRYPRFLRCDNGGEFISKKLQSLLDTRGITLAHSSPYHPEENGEAERLFWSYAQQVAAYIHNRIPHSRISPQTPIELLFNQVPVPEYIYPFGARALVFRPADKRTGKFDDRADECFLVGYPPSEKGWVFYNEHLKTFIHSANAVFPDFQTLPVSGIKTSKNDISFLLNNLVLGEEPTDTEAQIQQQAVDSLLTRPYIAVPDNIHQAFSSPESSEWRKAVELELGQLEKLEVWEVVESRKGIKVIGARWVFALKRDTEGKITRFKARYVARGFNQRPGTDCGDTYAPTASLNTLRLLFSIAAQMGMKMHSFDVSSAYLYSPIEEEVYVKPPTELRPELRGKVLRLKKALYGTKQAGRCWWLHFKTILNGLNFTTSEVESSLYVYKRDDVSIFIWMHVDDGLVVSNSEAAMEELREALQKQLEVKWKTHVDQIVGINVHEKLNGIFLEQNLLATQVVTNYCRPNDPVNVTDFRSVLGSLMYLACGTQPDIAYAVNMLARYSSRPSEEHWTTLDHLVGYVKKNPRRAINFSQGEDAVKLYVDAGWGGEHERSTTGFILQHCGNPITWGSKRQDVVAMSTCAAEYVALSIATQTLANIKVILDDICPSQRFEILCDNQAAVLVATDNASKKKTKYLQRAFYFVNDFVRKYKVKLYWISNQFQLADIFTKRLGASKHLTSLKDISVQDIPSTT